MLRTASVLTLTVILACGDSSSSGSGASGSGAAGPGGGGASDSTGTGAGECAPPPPLEQIETPNECIVGGVCAVNEDCEGGSRCNEALSPPSCTELYCGPAGSPCSDDLQCEDGLTCFEGFCDPCNVCGIAGTCSIDFDTDEDHCGCCNNPAPAGQQCQGGTTECLEPKTLCGDDCVKLDTAENCGACGATCGGDTGCSETDLPAGGAMVCDFWTDDFTQCGDACASIGMGCDPDALHRAVYCRIESEPEDSPLGWTTNHKAYCDADPYQFSGDGCPLGKLRCECTPQSQ